MTLHADALAVLRPGQPPTPAQAALRDRYVAHLAAHADGMTRACYPDHLTASTLVLVRRPGPGAADPARQGRPVVPVRRPLRARRPDPGRRRAARGGRGVRHRRTWRSTRCRSSSSEHAVPFCDPRGGVHHLDVRFVAVADDERRARGQRRVARRALVAGRRAARPSRTWSSWWRWRGRALSVDVGARRRLDLGGRRPAQ